MAKNALVLFTFKRYDSTIRLIRALQKQVENVPISFVIYHDYDGSDANVELTTWLEEHCCSYSYSLILRPVNFGLKLNVQSALDEISQWANYFIVLEDDLILDDNFRGFWQYLHRIDDDNVFEISGFPLSLDGNELTYHNVGSSWSWATSSKKWIEFRKSNEIKFYFSNFSKYNMGYNYPFTWIYMQSLLGRNDSWAIEKHLYMINNNLGTFYFKGIAGFYSDENFTHQDNGSISDVETLSLKRALLKLSGGSALINIIKIVWSLCVILLHRFITKLRTWVLF